MHSLEHAQGTNVILSHESEVLLLERRPGKWEFPGGTVNPSLDKTVLAAAIRETYEEVSLALNDTSLNHFWTVTLPGDVHKNVRRGPIDEHYFHACIDKQPIQFGPEHLSAEWVRFDEALCILPYPHTVALGMIALIGR